MLSRINTHIKAHLRAHSEVSLGLLVVYLVLFIWTMRTRRTLAEVTFKTFAVVLLSYSFTLAYYAMIQPLIAHRRQAREEESS